MREHRALVEGVIYRFRAGIAWRDLPAEFGPWQTVWKWHHRFSTDGTWDRVRSALQAQADAAGGIDWRVSVDSTIARVHQHGATAARAQLSSASRTGCGRLTKIRAVAGTNRTVTPSAGPVAV
jgi:transposase